MVRNGPIENVFSFHVFSFLFFLSIHVSFFEKNFLFCVSLFSFKDKNTHI